MQHIEDNTDNRTEQNREQQYAAHTEQNNTGAEQRTEHTTSTHIYSHI